MSWQLCGEASGEATTHHPTRRDGMDAQEERCILYDDTWTVGDKEVSTRLVRVDGAAGLEPVVYILLQFVRGEKCGRVEMMPNPPSSL